MTSPARILAGRLATLGPDAKPTLAAILARMSVTELAALAHDWEAFWARPKQILPQGHWKSAGFLTGLGFGKTVALSSFVCGEVEAGRARSVALCAQNEDKTYDVMIAGKSGLLAVSPPWFKAREEGGGVVWPNGARAFPYTPEVPGAMRGPEHDLVWLSEIIAWPAATREEAFANIERRARIGYGKLIWDTSPKKRHPILRKLLARAAKDPEKHIVVTGTMRENADFLTPGYVDEQYATYGGTQQGREELDGEFLDDSDEASFRQKWIDDARRDMPTALRRRILSIDPATSDRRGVDRTGIIDLGLGLDDQILVCADFTRSAPWEEWSAFAIDRYIRDRRDCIIVERNKVGDAPRSVLRAAAAARGFRVELLELDAPTRWAPGVIYLKEVFSRGEKSSRHEGATPLYAQGRASHVNGADLAELEDAMTTWVPGPGARSPDALDALVIGIDELTGHARKKKVDHAAGFVGIGAASKALQALTSGPVGGGSSIAALLGGGSGRSRI